MGAAYEVQVVLCQELCHAVWAKGVADASVVFAPPLQQQPHIFYLVCWHSMSARFQPINQASDPAG